MEPIRQSAAAGIQTYYPLTHPQMSIWYMEKLYPGISMGNICATLRFLENVDFDLLRKALNLFLEKNDATRLRFSEIDGQPMQYVAEYEWRDIEFFDFSSDVSELYKWDEKQTQAPFELLESDLCYIAMIKLSDSDGGYYIKMHHLAIDAWSMVMCGNQVLEYYHTLKDGQEYYGDKPSFLDTLAYEEEYKRSDRFIKDKDFWTEKFSDWKETTALKSRTSNAVGTRGRRKTLMLPQKLSNKIKEFCENYKVSEFPLFIAAVSMYLNRVTGREDVTLGTPLLNRTGAREKETLGMFASIAVPLRLNVTGDLNFENFIRTISKEILNVLRHQKYPYDLLLKDVRDRLKTTDNLFDIVISYQNSKVFNAEPGTFVSRWHFNGHQLESLIINLNDRDGNGRLLVDYDYLTDMFYAAEIEFIHQHIISLLWHALDNPQKPISRLEMISEAEKQKILYKFNDTKADFPENVCARQIFEDRAARTPDSIAVRCGNDSLTYAQINEKANRLAHKLISKGLGPDKICGLFVYRSFEMIIGILGILKAGGAWLPIDPDCPEARVKYMLSDCGAKLMLMHGKTRGRVYPEGVEIIDLDNEGSFSDKPFNPENINSARDLAYVIYTSGSTGNPKGVMLENRGLVNRINWMQKKYPLTQNSVILQKTPYTFDVSVWELTWWFFAGASVCMLKPGGEKDPAAIIEAIRDNNVTTMHFVPSMLGSFLDFLDGYRDIGALSSLRQVFASGEALSVQHAAKFNRLLNAEIGSQLYNLYGPTEASIDVTYFDCSPSVGLKSIPIGKPIDNTHLYILDKNLNLVPIGIPGELFIGGVGVARGYLNNTDLTKERFIQNPLVPGETIYKTGDLARWYAQGDIEYLGRLDHQLKIRGYRIELGEIENRMLMYRGIKEAVAVGLEEDGKKFLCAYYTSEADIPRKELKRFLAAGMPEYMVPSRFMRLEALPKSSNGKIDRKALPMPDGAEDESVPYAPPRNEIEAELVKIYSEVLNKPRVGIDDSLFDLDGDSLSVIQIYSRIYENGWGLNTGDFYTYPTIRELSDKISGVVRQDTEIGSIESPQWLWDKEMERPVTHRPSCVLLTGATGFLGIHILAELIENSGAVVYCLVRAQSRKEADARLAKQLHTYFEDRYDGFLGTRIRTVLGDVTQKRLGLTAREYEEIGAIADTVIHSAAMVKYFGEYSSIRDVNVLGTQEAIDFALNNGCRFHHISTVSITGNFLALNTINGTFSETDFFIGQNYYENMYVRSKFEAENLVYAAAGKGLSATVLRMGNLTGRYSDGMFQPNAEENGFYAALKAVVSMGAVSDNILNEAIEFSPVDLAAEAVVRIACTEQSDRHVFHVFNPYLITISELLGEFRKIGVFIEPQSNAQLEKSMMKTGSFNQALSGMAVYLKGTGELAYSVTIDIESKLTQKYLSKLGFKWPRIEKKYMQKLLNHLRNTGFLSK